MVSLQRPEPPPPPKARAAKPPEQLMLGGMRGLQHRQFWPHGYTPDRLAEVRQAMPAIGNFGGVDYGHEKDQVTKAIARSSIPPEHLKGLSHIATGITERSASEVLRGYDPARHRGYYNQNTVVGPVAATRSSFATPMTVPGGRGARQAARNQRDHTLLHEIGHHVDYSNNAGRTLSTGSREAIAENYALTHASPRGRRALPGYDEASHTLFNDRDHGDYWRGREHGLMPAIMPPAPQSVRSPSTQWPKYHQKALDLG